VFRKLTRVALLVLTFGAGGLAFWPSASMPAVHAQLMRWRSTLGTVAITDNFASVFALNRNHTWAGLPNRTGGASFVAFSLNPPVSYTTGYWRYDPRVPGVTLFGSDGTALASINGLNPRLATGQWGTTSPWPVSPATSWSFLP